MRYIYGFLCFFLYSTTILHAQQAAVVSAHPLASQAGLDVLKQGGNAFDAAAAVALSIGVVEPFSAGIGGGGFFMIYEASKDKYTMIDARETSPFLAGHGEVYQKASSIDGASAAGVPGLIAGIDHLSQKYGRLNREKISQHAIKYAQEGFAVSPHYQRLATWRKEALLQSEAKNIFLSEGEVPKLGQLIRQTQLAQTLQRFAKFGANDFYHGKTAKKLVKDMQRDGGFIRLKDLNKYRAIERQPIISHYKNTKIIAASLPSSGGLVLAEIFGMLAQDDLTAMSKVERTHLLVEVMRRAYRDRAAYMGDYDFISLPKDLLDPKRLQAMRQSIHMDKATPSSQLEPIDQIKQGDHTTHFSIVDAEGNRVSATLSINYGFGSAYVSPSTGILLNDEMDDFVTQAGKANVYGLVGSAANQIEPQKRMLSSMTPCFAINEHGILITGTPGGSRIISMVLLNLLQFAHHEPAAPRWLSQKRFHHQYLPDIIQHEKGAFNATEIKALQAKGHQLKAMRNYGNMQSILQTNTGEVIGLSDPRGEGLALKLDTPSTKRRE
ncbi:MAG: gamma-glutamyltransferase [Mariprofundaceae bacterium]|nr:gamma-glutamyltransferase [Mariprofundaceae bacterium]